MKILYFAKVREFIGYAEEEINLPSDIKTVDDVLDYLISKDSKYEMASVVKTPYMLLVMKNMLKGILLSLIQKK